MKKLLFLFIALMLIATVGCGSHPPTMSREEYKFYNSSNIEKGNIEKKKYKKLLDDGISNLKESNSMPENLDEIEDTVKVYSKTINENISNVKKYNCKDDLKEYQDLLISYYELENEYLQLISDILISQTKKYDEEEIDEILKKRESIDLEVSNKSLEIFHNKVKDF